MRWGFSQSGQQGRLRGQGGKKSCGVTGGGAVLGIRRWVSGSCFCHRMPGILGQSKVLHLAGSFLPIHLLPSPPDHSSSPTTAQRPLPTAHSPLFAPVLQPGCHWPTDVPDQPPLSAPTDSWGTPLCAPGAPAALGTLPGALPGRGVLLH